MATKNTDSGGKEETKAGFPSMPGMPAFGDVNKMLEQFKVPGVDMQALLDGRKKDIDAVTAANKRAYEGMKTLAERQAEMLKESIAGLQSAVKELSSLPATERATRTAELGKVALEKTLANMRELAESSVKSQTEAWTIVSEHFRQNLAQMQKAFKKD